METCSAANRNPALHWNSSSFCFYLCTKVQNAAARMFTFVTFVNLNLLKQNVQLSAAMVCFTLMPLSDWLLVALLVETVKTRL